MTDPIDELLEQLQQSESDQPPSNSPSIDPTPVQPAANSIDHLLTDVEESPSKSAVQTGQMPSQPTLPAAALRARKSLEALLWQLDHQVPPAHFSKERIVSTPVASQADLQAIKRQRQRAIEYQAQIWLDSLDPEDGDAIFFESLAEKYPSRLEAAIDFLGLDQE